MPRTCDARNYSSEQPGTIREKKEYHFDTLKLLRVLNQAYPSPWSQWLLYEANKLAENLRPVDVGIEAPVPGKGVEHAREIGGRGSVSCNGFHCYFFRRSFPTTGPCISRKSLDTFVA